MVKKIDKRTLDEYRNNTVNLSMARIRLMNDHEKKIVATYEECGSLDKTAKANALSEEQVAEVLQKAEVYEDRKRRFERYEGNKKVRDIETVTGEEVIHGTETDHVITEEQERQFLEEYINELSPESGHFTGKKNPFQWHVVFG